MGIETKWIKNSSGVSLQISPEEWETAKQFAENNYAFPIATPFKITRKLLGGDHSFIVLPAENNTYKLGALARGKIFTCLTTGETRIEGILGHGAFGVAKIIQWQDGTIDAVKIEDAENKTRNPQENQIMRALGRLRSTFVVPRIRASAWIRNSKIRRKSYTIQEKINGIDIRDYFISAYNNALRIREMEVCEIALKSAIAIKQLHDLNTLHCDIKPANFLVNWAGDFATIAAVDFGFAKMLLPHQTKIRTPHDICGTPKYIAPEIYYERLYALQGRHGPKMARVVRQEGEYSKASDIYALGIMFREDFGISCDIVTRMIEKNPQKRPSVEEVIQELTDITEELRQQKSGPSSPLSSNGATSSQTSA